MLLFYTLKEEQYDIPKQDMLKFNKYPCEAGRARKRLGDNL